MVAVASRARVHQPHEVPGVWEAGVGQRLVGPRAGLTYLAMYQVSRLHELRAARLSASVPAVTEEIVFSPQHF